MVSDRENFNLNIWDHSSIAYCVMELVLDDENRPVDRIYRYCNQAFADLKGYRLETILDHSYSDLYPESDAKGLSACYRAAYEDIPCEMDTSFNNEKYHVAFMPSGMKGFCTGTIFKAQMENNSETEKTDTLLDDNYMIRQLLPDYVSLYSLELNSGKYEILRLAGNTNATEIADNPAYKGLNFDEYAREYAKNFIRKEDQKEFLDWHLCKNMKKSLMKSDKVSFHYQSISKDGTPRYYEGYAVRGKITDESFQIFLGYRNIDSILYKEKAIQERIQRVLDETNLRNEIITSIAKTYQYISRIDIKADWYEEISNRDKYYSKYEHSGIQSANTQKACRKYVAEEYQEAFLKFTDLSTLPERMATEETIVIEYQMKDGNWHKLRFIEKKRDKKGQLTHVICVIRSISDIKKREQELLYQVGEAKKDAALKTRFLSNMSHDIRTPMNGIIGMIELADSHPDDSELQKKCREKIMESSRFLVSMVNDILDMNKLESGDVVKQELPFDLTELLNKVNTSRQTAAAAKNVEYIVDWDKSDMEHVHLTGNPLYLERLLYVVADNAVKFTTPGGRVNVWCIEKSGDDGQAEYEFGCSDNGIGMSKNFLEHAFDVFSQENETSRSRYEGSGLGLPIAKRLVERMGGRIELKSQKDVGTTVIMTVPFKIDEERKSEKRENNKGISLEGRHVLLAEDNELNMEIAKLLLEDKGLLVDCAYDGIEAVKRFEQSVPGYYDIVFMDIMMPNLNGWDAARKIRSMKRPDADKVAIIAMSANTFAEDIINSRIAGMNDHIAKPIDKEKIEKVLYSSLA